jgi:hypothetical protein
MVADGGMSKITQCTQVPMGASGSSQTRAKLLVPAGLPDHSSGGEKSAPSQVYFAGIISPLPKALLVISIGFPPFAR